jgi:hypothetical protein
VKDPLFQYFELFLFVAGIAMLLGLLIAAGHYTNLFGPHLGPH